MITPEIARRFEQYRVAGLPDYAALKAHSDIIRQRHIAYRGADKKNPFREFMADLGQRRLAYLTGGKMDMYIRPGHQGDGHIDQQLYFLDGRDFPADVKTITYPKDLAVWVEDMHELDPNKRWIFILGTLLNQKNEHGELNPQWEWDANLICWDWDSNLRKSKPKKYDGHDLLNYWVPNPFWRGYRGEPTTAKHINELIALVRREAA